MHFCRVVWDQTSLLYWQISNFFPYCLFVLSITAHPLKQGATFKKTFLIQHFWRYFDAPGNKPQISFFSFLWDYWISFSRCPGCECVSVRICDLAARVRVGQWWRLAVGPRHHGWHHLQTGVCVCVLATSLFILISDCVLLLGFPLTLCFFTGKKKFCLSASVSLADESVI